MACNQTTKQKGRKRKLLRSDYTEFGGPPSVKNQQSTDKLNFSGISDIEHDSFGEFSDLQGQKNRTSLPDVPIFHGDLLPLSQAGKFIPKFQTKLNRKSTTTDHIATEDVKKKKSSLSKKCVESKCPIGMDPLDCNFQQCLETRLMKNSKYSPDNSATGNLLLNEESRQTEENTGHTFAGAAPFEKKLNLTTNDECEELDVGTSEDLFKKSGKGRLQRMPTKTLGIKKIKSSACVSHTSKAERHPENTSCRTNGTEGENVTSVNSLENGVIDAESKLETIADDNSQDKSGEKNNLYPDNMISEKNNLYPDNMISEKNNLHRANMSNAAEMKRNVDWIHNRVGAFDDKLSVGDTGLCVVKIERLKLFETDSFGAKFPQMDLHTEVDETKIKHIVTNSDQNELTVKSAHTGQHHQNLTPILQLDANEVDASAEFPGKGVNDIQLFLSNTGNKDKESDHCTENRNDGSARSKLADDSCPKTSQKTGDQLLVTTSATSMKSCDHKASDSEKISHHNTEKEETSITTITNCEATLQSETDLTTPKCTEFNTLLNAELNHIGSIQTTAKFNAEAIQNSGETEFMAELGMLSERKGTELITEPIPPSDILHQKPNDLGQGNDFHVPAGQSAYQEPHSTFDDFTDVTDSQMYLLDEESFQKSTSSCFTNMPMPSTGICCPSLANISKALNTSNHSDSLHINEAKRKEGNKILQDMIKELTTVNAQLIRYRREVERAKKERMEHLRSTSCFRQNHYKYAASDE